MVDPLERAEEETERIALDLSPSDLRFLERFAAYRNVMNELQGRTIRSKWSRKSAAEAFVSAHVGQVRDQMKDVFDELGELPADEKALREYAEKVLARSGVKSSKKSR
jgi:hypothetical protein